MPGNATNTAGQSGGRTHPRPPRLDNQGRLQPRTADKSKQPEPERSTKLSEPAAEKKGSTGRPVTRGAEVNPLTREEIVDLPDQDIMDAEEGKSYLEHVLLTVPGESWTIDTLSTSLLQVTQLKGVTRPINNALRAIALVLTRLDRDEKSEKIAVQVNTHMSEQAEGLLAKAREASTVIDKAAANATASIAHSVAEATASAVQDIRAATSSVTTSTARLTETTMSYKDILTKAASQNPSPLVATTPVPTLSLDARVTAREGIKLRQILIDASAPGE